MIHLSPAQAAMGLGASIHDAEPRGGTAAGAATTLLRRVCIDSREVQPGDLFVAVPGARFDGHDFIEEAAARGAVVCVCRRQWWENRRAALPLPALVVEDTIRALGQLAAYYRRSVMSTGTVVVAVTGSNGKTTTKYMIDHVLKSVLPGRCSPKSFNNHIGVPLTLLSAERTDRYLVVEVGTNAPGEIAALAALASPDVGVVTSIGEAHLEGLGSLSGVAAEKCSLLDHVRPLGLAVVNVDRPEVLAPLARAIAARLVTVGFDPAAKLRVAKARAAVATMSFELDGRFHVELPMPGAHHATNAAAAFAVCRWFGLAPETIIERLRSFAPPEGRTRVLEFAGLTVIDDAYNANPASMAAAVASLRQAAPRRRVLVMGDMLELGADHAAFHERVVREALAADIEVLLAVGPHASAAARVCERFAGSTRLVLCEDASAAGAVLLSLLSPGDVVWIKGSRAMRLDRVVEDLKAHREPKAAVA
ncbi:MAG: UDP-N-acetylmuramoyl-tripeptide--D-alanyl-D-alanine ligase [Planctomycetes bacterium]|nr:UDP-N-acetylmuramoyl-tripeptide--D-alanyl-D-alanine ligase [Planctomycetota bacterium]